MIFIFNRTFFISLSLYRTTQNINNCRNEVRMMHDATMQGSPRKKFNKIRELNRRRNYFTKEGANKQVISSQADSLIKISRIWAD
ncbi:hypothetical protein ACJWSK_22485, partial [Klebsiella pneumoniae]